MNRNQEGKFVSGEWVNGEWLQAMFLPLTTHQPVVFWIVPHRIASQLNPSVFTAKVTHESTCQFLRPSNALGTLQGDGWEIEMESEAWIFAKHADVADEISARKRLDHSNLLTSGSIRVDFQDFRRRIQKSVASG